MRQAVGILLVLSSCAQPPPRDMPFLDPSKKEEIRHLTYEDYIQNVRKIVVFFHALNLFNSPDPLDWNKALLDLEGPELRDFEVSRGLLHPEQVEDASDRKLIGWAGGTDPKLKEASRKELGDRAKLFYNLCKFYEPYDPVGWETAKRALVAMDVAAGDDPIRRHRAKIQLALFMLEVLTSPERTKWPHARFYLSDLGPIGTNAVVAYLEQVLLPKVPSGPPGLNFRFNFYKDKLQQCLMALLQMGSGPAREYFLKVGRDPRPWVKITTADAIVESKDVSRLDLLETYVRDPDEDVRAKACACLGRMSYARDEAGEILLRALEAEKEEACLASIAGALVTLRYRGGIPQLVKLLDHPHYPVVVRVMDALEGLTGASRVEGHKLQTPAEWKRFLQDKRPGR